MLARPRFFTLCGSLLALCGACEQSPESSQAMMPQPPANVPAGSAGETAPPGAANAGVGPGVSAPGSAQPAAGGALPAGPVQAPAGQKPSTMVDAPQRYPGLPIGPDVESQFVNGVERLIPMDTRTAVQALGATPVSGGTLLITADGLTAVAADPDRDRVSIVDLTTTWLVATVALKPGDEPGRMVQDNANRVHVVLRRGGAVASIDLLTRAVVARRDVCASPRGIAFDGTSKMLKVACMGGELVELPAATTGEVASRVRIDSDLRDIVQVKSTTFVTRLKSAELIALGAGSARGATGRPVTSTFFFPDSDGSQIADSLEPVGARRTIATRDGGMIMLHQGARNGEIEVKADDDPGNTGVVSSPYGGSGSCTGVVTSSVTRFDALGKPLGTVQFNGVLAVDVSESAQSSEIAIALAGAPDPNQPAVQIVPRGSGAVAQPAPADIAESISVLQFESAALLQAETPGTPTCLNPVGAVSLPGPATAVAYAGDRLIAQTREPAALFILEPALANQGRDRVQIDLGGASVRDTGHDIFHRDAGAGVACASCHLEGGDDGHVWHFVDQGPRRTQSMQVGLGGTAPFHWVGDMTDLGTLMENVFVGRMGGVHQSPARLSGLESWVNALKAPVPLRPADDPAVLRGKDVFFSDAECGKCHTGAKFTNNQTVDVGTGLPLQVPSLVGVAYRGPWIHTGCAATLDDRFDAACGGDKHGRVDTLTQAQRDDLVAYLESL